MQPYIFPYIGYFQLIKAVDRFVVYDDVTYIKGGWINRNNYLLHGEAKLFNINLDQASSFKKINEIEILDNERYKPKKKLVSTLEMAYRKAPYFKEIMPMIEQMIMNPEKNIARYITDSLKMICDYLDITTEIFISSTIEKNNQLNRGEKVIEICHRLDGDVYINSIGGKALYDKKDFADDNIELYFIKTDNNIVYKQFDKPFVPNLSILDILFFNNKETIQSFLERYTLE